MQVLDDIRDRLPEAFNMEDIRSRVPDLTPYIMVAIQVGYVLESPCHVANDDIPASPIFADVFPSFGEALPKPHHLNVCTGVREAEHPPGGDEAQLGRAGPGAEGGPDNVCANGGNDGIPGE